jgi:iron complex outermembrane receptor protein
VINIVTKTDQDYGRSELRARGGSYDTAEVDGIFKQQVDVVTALLSVQGRTTDGHRPLITADAQTFFDNIYGTSASSAPGEAETWFRESNVSLDFFTSHWRTRLQARDHHLGMGTSLFSSLSQDGEGSARIYNFDVFYNNTEWAENWSVKVNAGLMDAAIDADKPFLPKGAFDNQFPDGLLTYGLEKERHLFLDVKSFYHGNPYHESMIGAGIFNAEIYETDSYSNYTVLPGGIYVPKGSYTADPESQRFFQVKSRKIKYITAHDDWNADRDYIFSIGARYDDYSDFGGTFNPRIALIWLARQDITAKLIMNRAFRAPTLVELYSPNPAQVGNPDLKPSIISAQEFVLEKSFINDERLQLTFFHHVLKDSIQALPDISGNLATINSQDDIVGKGAEIELSMPLAQHARLNSSYSYQINTVKGDSSYTAYSGSPHHKVYAGIDWQFKPNWNLYSNVLWVNKFTRDINDPRDGIGDDAFVGAVLRYKSSGKRWESWLSVRNIFDRNAVVPSDDYRFLPDDIPLPGTNFIAEFLYRL